MFGLRGGHTVSVMARHSRSADEGSSTTELEAIAARLREAAIEAGRLDVAAKADEAIALLTNAGSPLPDGQEPARHDTGNAVLRTLDGLGF